MGSHPGPFENVIDLTITIERAADFLLIAGDVFDGDQLDFNAALFFANQLRRLNDADIRAFIVRGNHDALSKISALGEIEWVARS